MSGEKNINKLIATMTPELVEEEFVFGSLFDADLEVVLCLQPIATFQEQEGLTVVIPRRKADQHDVEYTGVFKCLSLTVHSSLEAVGLTAAVATSLAEENISANVVAAFYHDHIFVPAQDAERALACLETLARYASAEPVV
ncbi:hypothetical protein EDC56_0967 [Sinobacterium caligoides]|uniref:Uncharacterized protein n=1 Tax=Sinobacterium caligoides TaxID=933926 RepID=A0A3N2E091_9GAMM|nr:ACT domain-containing protein [Sinobacterium caligoides]ROS05437.1 hypothetical protein EDC56_0967 [Sinobacterium caligoides]